MATTVASSGADEPAGIAVDASGNVYLADTQNFRILKLQQANVGFGGVNIGSKSAALSPSEAIDHVVAAVQKWSTTQDDDLTVLVCDFVGA